jgi:hypothetical protein
VPQQPPTEQEQRDVDGKNRHAKRQNGEKLTEEHSNPRHPAGDDAVGVEQQRDRKRKHRAAQCDDQ